MFAGTIFIHKRNKRTSAASEFVLHNEWIKIVPANKPWNNLFIIYITRFISDKNLEVRT